MTALSREQEDFIVDWAESGNAPRERDDVPLTRGMLSNSQRKNARGERLVKLNRASLTLAHYIKRGRELESALVRVADATNDTCNGCGNSDGGELVTPEREKLRERVADVVVTKRPWSEFVHAAASVFVDLAADWEALIEENEKQAREIEALINRSCNDSEQLQTVHAHVAEACEILGLNRKEHMCDSWSLRQRSSELIAERDRLTARVEELEPKWLPIESAPRDVFHFRAITVRNSTTGTTWWDHYYGHIDDYGDFVDEEGNDFGWRAEDYDLWCPANLPELPPLPSAPKGGEDA